MNELIAEYGETITITRLAAGAYDGDGEYVAGEETELEVVARVQPMTDQEKKALADGEDATSGLVLYTETELVASSKKDQTKGDVFGWGGTTYEVVRVTSRDGIEGLEHFKILALEVDA